MPTPPSFALASVLFVGLMGAAVWSDARERRLPNRLMLATLLTGLVMRIGMSPGGAVSSVEGVLLGVGLGVPLFLLGAIGGGDVKLIAAAGAFLGPRELVWALLLGAALGLLLVVDEAARRKVAIPALYRTKDLAVHALTLGRRGGRPLPEDAGAIKVPYGIAIAAGAVLAWFAPMSGVVR